MTTQEVADPLLAPPDEAELVSLNAWWRAANYLTVGQIYLQDNALMREPLRPEHIKPRLLGHWGTSPGLSFVYAHAARMIRLTGERCLFLAGPGHGGPAVVAAAWLEGAMSQYYPEFPRDGQGMATLFRKFSAPGGIPSHASATTPGSIHEGGELGYVLSHAHGAVMDDKDALAIAVVGDGEAETAALEGSWKAISFANPVRDGAVLPVLHLNDAKISGPTVLGRKEPQLLRKLLEGHGYEVLEVGGSDVPGMHLRFAETLARAHRRIVEIRHEARDLGRHPIELPPWPVIVMRTPKGWTGPKMVDGVPVEGTWRAHQVPLSEVRSNPEHLLMLEEWMRSYRPEELFDEAGRPTDLVLRHNPALEDCMSLSPGTNGGRSSLDLPAIRAYEAKLPAPGRVRIESTRVLGSYLRDVYRANPDRFRLFGPDETNSNRLGNVFEASDRAFMERTYSDDVSLSDGGRVMEVLSENLCQGWLEGYTLTGRHGLFATYEAFAMVSASQTIQHTKWLESAKEIPWRKEVPSLNILLTSTAWRNDHNGFSHQGPGLLHIALTARPDVMGAFLPPDANTLMWAADQCLRSTSRVNLLAIDKQPQLQWLTCEQAKAHCDKGAGVWDWAGSEPHEYEQGQGPDIVLACAGDIVTQETVAAAQLIKQHLPPMHVRVVNVVDLLALRKQHEHFRGMDPVFFSECFTDDVDVVFAFHGYPGSIHALVHNRPEPDRFRVRGFIEQGTTTTPFDMVVRNLTSRYHLVMDALKHSKRTLAGAEELYDYCRNQLRRHERYIVQHLEDMPEVRDWSL